ncbi:MAG: MBL fold metallo-hydrolase [Candidatus Thorarchaeota archaeon]
MFATRNSKIIAGAILITIVIVAPAIYLTFLNQGTSPVIPPDDDNDPLEIPVTSVNITLLDTAGVMIEANNIRIYIDPYRIPKDNFSNFPADLILITHAHVDHYSASDIRDIQKNSTMVVCPATMTTQLERYNNSLGVKPGDSFLYRGINITAFDLYLENYPSGVLSAHPKANNWTSYIIDIDGFVIFHAGDAKYMEEYEDFTAEVDVALLPIYYDPGYGTKDESLAPIIQVIEEIQPSYCIPTHWYNEDNVLFMDEYVPFLVDDCIVMNLDFWESHVFSNDS